MSMTKGKRMTSNKLRIKKEQKTIRIKKKVAQRLSEKTKQKSNRNKTIILISKKS